MALTDYSATAGSNSSISGIDITGATGRVKDGDNAIRQLMADLKAGVLIGAGYTTTATAAGTTTLTVASTSFQRFTGATTQTIVMPVTSTLTLGSSWVIVNDSTGVLTINSSGSNLIATVGAGQTLVVECILTSGTSAASWSVIMLSPWVAGGSDKGNTSSIVYTYTDSGAGAGPITTRHRDSSSPTTNDAIGGDLYTGKGSDGVTYTYAAIQAGISSAASGVSSGNGTLDLRVTTGTSGVLSGLLLTGIGTTVSAAFNGAVTAGGALTVNGTGTSTIAGPLNIAGAAAGQVVFPASQNASANANTLDDYAETSGNLGAVASSSGTITTVGTKTYVATKVGRKVTVHGSVAITDNGTGSGRVNVDLPYTSAGGLIAFGSGRNATTALALNVLIPSGSATAQITLYDSTYPVATGQTLTFSITYFTS
jgi:hypothetical protein